MIFNANAFFKALEVHFTPDFERLILIQGSDPTMLASTVL